MKRDPGTNRSHETNGEVKSPRLFRDFSSSSAPGRANGPRFWKSHLGFIIAIASILAVAALGIETMRRWEPMKPTALPDANDRVKRSFPRELQDANGQTLIIPHRPQRIVSETLGTDEILLSICEPERIVALSTLAQDMRYSNVAKEARAASKPAAQGPEFVLRLKPDLIFVASYSSAEFVELLRSSRAPVFRFANFDRIEDIKSNIRAVGYAIGNDAKAEVLVKEMEQQLETARSRIPATTVSPRVMSFGRLGYTAGSNTLFDDIVRHAGAINVSAKQGLVGFTRISSEKILEWQPDFIVTGAETEIVEETRAKLLADPAIAASRAGRAGHVTVLDNRHFLTVSHHIVRGLEDLIKALYAK
jgi:iron complex transport system substrate-binding protein